MIIFSIYSLGESATELALIQEIKKYRITELTNQHPIISACIHEIEKSQLKYVRLMACVVAIDKMSAVNVEPDTIMRYKNELIKYIEPKSRIHPSLRNEIAGLVQKPYFSNPNSFNIKKEDLSKRFYTLRPQKSGFFSVIDNVLNAYILAYLENKRLVVSLEEGCWWVYNCEIQKILALPGLHFVSYPKKISSLLRFKKIDYYRKKFFGSPEKTLYKYSAIKVSCYAAIYNNIVKNFPDLVPKSEYDTAIYLRQGDKSKLEDFEWDINFFLENICWDNTHNYYVLSDNIPKIKKNKYPTNIKFDDDDYSGYFFGKEKNSDHSEIIRKFLIMVQSNNFIGDAGSNFVNSTAWTRIGIGKHPISQNPIFGTPPYVLI